MHITFRRDDGREFVFEEPDAKCVTKDCGVLLDQYGYQSMLMIELTLETLDVSLASELNICDRGEIAIRSGRVGHAFAAFISSRSPTHQMSQENFEEDGVITLALQVESALQFTFMSISASMSIPADEIRDWLNP